MFVNFNLKGQSSMIILSDFFTQLFAQFGLETICFLLSITSAVLSISFSLLYNKKKQGYKDSKMYKLIFNCFAFFGLTILVIDYIFVKNYVSGFAYNNLFFEKTYYTQITSICLIFMLFFYIAIIAYKKQHSFTNLSLVFASLCGSFLLISSKNLIAFYMSFELQSLPIFIMLAVSNTKGLNFKDNPKNTDNENFKSNSLIFEVVIKYFVISSILSCLLVYGLSLFYANFKTFDMYKITSIASIFTQIETHDSLEKYSNLYGKSLLIGILFIIIALFGKLSLAPFHFWAPDLYQKISKQNLFYILSIPKIATIFAIFVFLTFVKQIISPYDFNTLTKVFLFFIVISLIVGSFGGIRQQNLQRLIAYSGIINASFFIILLLLPTHNNATNIYISIFYTVVYVLNFTVVLLAIAILEKKYSVRIQNLSDLIVVKQNPILAFCLMSSVFSIAGIPPLSGFFTKFVVLKYVLDQNLFIFCILLATSVVAGFYYLNIIRNIFFSTNQVKYQALQSYALSDYLIYCLCIVLTALNFFIVIKPSVISSFV